MKIRQYRYFMCDFETTVYRDQLDTEVWASASVELGCENVRIDTNIGHTFDYFKSLKSNIIAYYHNLKFDGSFILPYLINVCRFAQAYDELPDGSKQWHTEKVMQNNTFKYSISDRGQWYNIVIKVGGFFIEIRDSLKLLPFSVDRMAKSFKTSHQKLTMEYEGYRYSGCEITDKERIYIANDVLVVKECLEIMFADGHNKLTIGGCCLAEYKAMMGKDDFDMYYPNIYDTDIDEDKYGTLNQGEYVRKSFKGGWCFLKKEEQGKLQYNGTTADVNSLYPSMMHSESGNRYPIGNPNFWSGDTIPDIALKTNRYYFVRIKTRFYLKPKHLPFIQIKNSFLYKGTECLESSDIYNQRTDTYHSEYMTRDGIKDTRVTLTLTMSDYELFKDHYDLIDFEILDGCWFFSEIGLFDDYVDKFKKIKINSTGAKRELAKLFSNNLYGKMASSTSSSFKVAYVKDTGDLGFDIVTANDKKPGYIPVGSAITSYSRCYTIRAAQANYEVFIYADTDSIHCKCQPKEIKKIKIHPLNYNNWKLEATWDVAIFTRQKTYIEHVVEENLETCDPYYSVKCAGMPTKCKELFLHAVNQDVDLKKQEEMIKPDYNKVEIDFLKHKLELTDFKLGLCVPSKLRPKRLKSGILLVPTTFQMR